MARIFLLAIGSRGDVQPLVALGSSLVEAGHEVVLATPMGFETLVEGRGITHVEVTRSHHDAEVSGLDSDVVETVRRRPVREVRELIDSLHSHLDEILSALPAAAKGADLVLWWDLFGNVGRHVAEALGVPGVACGLNPENWVSSTIPVPEPFPWPPRWLPPSWRARYIRFGHAVVLQLYASLWRSRVNRWRRDVLGLSGLPHRASAVEKVAAPTIRLSAVSQLVRELPPEWQGQVVQTGYWILPPAKDWVMPTKLRAFLDDGPPPIFASVGDAGSYPPELGPMMIEAARSAGVRLVLGSGWNGMGGLDTDDLPPHVIEAGEVPHEIVFPLMSGIIHHGGGGSTAAALRAGVPSVALPVFADQPYWGRRIAELGVGLKPLPAKKVTVDQLIVAMCRLRNDEPMRRRAAELGALLRDEDGVTTAVRMIEALLLDEFDDDLEPLHDTSSTARMSSTSHTH